MLQNRAVEVAGVAEGQEVASQAVQEVVTQHLVEDEEEDWVHPSLRIVRMEDSKRLNTS